MAESKLKKKIITRLPGMSRKGQRLALDVKETENLVLPRIQTEGCNDRKTMGIGIWNYQRTGRTERRIQTMLDILDQKYGTDRKQQKINYLDEFKVECLCMYECMNGYERKEEKKNDKIWYQISKRTSYIWGKIGILYPLNDKERILKNILNANWMQKSNW